MWISCLHGSAATEKGGSPRRLSMRRSGKCRSLGRHSPSLAATFAVLLCLLPGVRFSPTATPRIASVFGWGFDAPGSLAVVDGNLWVTNFAGNDITELNARTGAFKQTLSSSKYGFQGPDALVRVGPQLWIANELASSVTVVNPKTGAFLRTISGTAFDFGDPSSMAVVDGNVWVAGGGTNVTEVNGTTGALVQVIGPNEPADHIDGAVDLLAAGQELWIANLQGESITELNGETGSLLQSISSPSGTSDFLGLGGLAMAGGGLWASSTWTNSVVHLDPGTGAILGIVSSSQVPLGSPTQLLSSDGDLWVLNNWGLTELAASDGSLLRTVGSTIDPTRISYVTAAANGDLWASTANSPTGSVALINGSSGSVIEVERGDYSGVGFVRSIAFTGGDIWMLCPDGLLEIDQSTGVLLRIVNAPDFRLDQTGSYGAQGLVSYGDNLWVANTYNDSLTEIDSKTAALVRVVDAPADGLDAPVALALAGSDLWIASQSSLTELNAQSGALVRTVNTSGDLDGLSALSVNGSRLWVSGSSGLMEFNTTSGRLTQIVRKGLSSGRVVGVAATAGVVWAIGYGADGVQSGLLVEFNASDGALIQMVKDRGYRLGEWASLTVSNGELWIANSLARGALVELDPVSGSVERVVSQLTPEYGLDDPVGIALTSRVLWTFNNGEQSLVGVRLTPTT